MFKRILLVLAVLVLGLLGYASTRPDSFRMERSITVKAPPDKIHGLIADFRQWAGWSPWEKLDPAMKRTFSGPASGPGAVYAWEGNSKVGAGRMEIVEAVVPGKVRIKLDFLAPMQASNTSEFTLTPQGDGATVTWAMYGPSPFLSKLMQVFISMDSMVGKDFEAGLANLKTLAER